MRDILAATIRVVAADIEEGSVKPGQYRCRNPDGSPCCALWHVVDRYQGDAWGYKDPREAVLRHAVMHANDLGDWPATVKAMRAWADLVEAT